MKIMFPKSDGAHINHEVRVPIYILIFAIYLSRRVGVRRKNRMKLYTNRISKGRMEIIV